MQALDKIIADANQLFTQAQESLQTVQSVAQLDVIRIDFLGKKGSITQLLQRMKHLSGEQRPIAGASINKVKKALHALIKQQSDDLEHDYLQNTLLKQKIDITWPGYRNFIGNDHPVLQVIDRLQCIFSGMGFTSVLHSEVEDDYHNFSALNIPEHHPARTMHDTFYLQENYLLRTHTTPSQIRIMRDGVQPPLRIISYGRVYRRDALDSTHSPMFHQLDGVWVDTAVTFSDLKGVLYAVLKAFFSCEPLLRFRASYFPFTEPSAEVDIQCLSCKGKGCRTCSNSGWIEVLGCGMVHPNVLTGMQIDTEQYTGFAFGMGIERLAMFLYGVDDVRQFFLQ